MSSLLLSFLDARTEGNGLFLMGIMAAGVAAIFLFSTSTWIDRVMGRLISAALLRFTDLDVRDYARPLHLRDDYGVSELSIGEAGLLGEGVLVLGIECPAGTFIGAPPEDTPIRARDRLIPNMAAPRGSRRSIVAARTWPPITVMPKRSQSRWRSTGKSDCNLGARHEPVRAGPSRPISTHPTFDSSL